MSAIWQSSTGEGARPLGSRVTLHRAQRPPVHLGKGGPKEVQRQTLDTGFNRDQLHNDGSN